MAITENAKKFHEKMFPGYESDFLRTDPEFIELFDNFAFDEVIEATKDVLDDKTGFMTTLAVLIGCQGIDEFIPMVKAALNFGVTPEEIKEIVYQAVAYIGIGRVFPYLKATNCVFESCNIKIPTAPASTTNRETRIEAGEAKQVEIFGERMKDLKSQGDKETNPINRALVGNCFGDYYTRKGLDARLRELMTFCYLYSQGGCESQLQSHTAANLRNGNSRAFLIAVLIRNIPFMGYPRTLNALRIVNEQAEKLNG